MKWLKLIGIGLIAYGSYLGATSGPMTFRQAMERHFLSREHGAFGDDGHFMSQRETVDQVARTTIGFILIALGSTIIGITVLVS